MKYNQQSALFLSPKMLFVWTSCACEDVMCVHYFKICVGRANLALLGIGAVPLFYILRILVHCNVDSNNGRLQFVASFCVFQHSYFMLSLCIFISQTPSLLGKIVFLFSPQTFVVETSMTQSYFIEIAMIARTLAREI